VAERGDRRRGRFRIGALTVERRLEPLAERGHRAGRPRRRSPGLFERAAQIEILVLEALDDLRRRAAEIGEILLLGADLLGHRADYPLGFAQAAQRVELALVLALEPAAQFEIFADRAFVGALPGEFTAHRAERRAVGGAAKPVHAGDDLVIAGVGVQRDLQTADRGLPFVAFHRSALLVRPPGCDRPSVGRQG
jgi:hypothetical protein